MHKNTDHAITHVLKDFRYTGSFQEFLKKRRVRALDYLLHCLTELIHAKEGMNYYWRFCSSPFLFFLYITHLSSKRIIKIFFFKKKSRVRSFVYYLGYVTRPQGSLLYNFINDTMHVLSTER